MNNNNQKIKIEGTWKGQTCNINTVWGGHTFTNEELTKLFNDEIIEFNAISKAGNEYKAKGKLEKQEYNGNSFIGFKPIFDNNNQVERFEGIWKGKTVRIKKVWSGHIFTDNEIKQLLNDETIEFNATSKSGNIYKVKGKLEEQEYNGIKFIGFKPTFNN